MTGVTIATGAHVAEIARLIGELRAQEGLDEPVTAQSVQTYLDEADTDVLVATAEAGSVVGVLSLRVMRDLFHGRAVALIQELVVAEGRRGEGIGGALLDAALDRARERGCIEIGVTTGQTNEAGQAAYRSRGFESDGVYFERHFEE
ncbi:MAG: GNAT family N-acetyltransferase [Coriobacteriia bacterium]|nr:GNAT family N-acetyltransferase [Coriobacteriia bacterium]